MAPEDPNGPLPEKLLPQLRPMLADASKYSSQAIVKWADLLYPHALEDEEGNVIEHASWRKRLGHFYDWALREGYECPGDVSYLMRLVETKQRINDMGLTWTSFAVRPSVLIEGRNLDREVLREILETEGVEKDGKVKLTVSRMKAHVKKHAKNDPRSVDIIEEEMSANRRDTRERSGAKRSPTEQVVTFIKDTKPELVLNAVAALAGVSTAKVKKLLRDGGDIDEIDLEAALSRVEELTTVLEEAAQVSGVSI
jgi:hypothetical protein